MLTRLLASHFGLGNPNVLQVESIIKGLNGWSLALIFIINPVKGLNRNKSVLPTAPLI